MRLLFLVSALLLASCSPDSGTPTTNTTEPTPIDLSQDTLSPTVYVFAPTTTQNGSFPVILLFSEPVTGLALADISITGATASGLSGSGATYSFDVIPPLNSANDITISIPASIATDGAGNDNLAADPVIISVDTFVPTATISAPTAVQTSLFNANITFSEPVTGFTLSDLVIGGGSASSLAGLGAAYTFDITPNPSSVSDVTIDLPANSVFDSGNNGNLAAPQHSTPIDTVIPAVYIAAPTSPQATTFSVNIIFSEAVTGLTLSDFTVTNGTPSNLNGTGSQYTLDITPNSGATGSIGIDLAANTVVDLAGNANDAAPHASTPIDLSVPSVSITAPSTVQTGLFTATITFSKPITGLTLTDFTITNGLASNLLGSGANYTVDITPNANISSNLTMSLAANTVVDAAGNGNTAAIPAVTPIDTILPSVTTITAPSTAQNALFPVNITFSEPVTGLALSDFTISGGSVSNLAGSGAAYTFDITPAANSTTSITIGLAANKAFDAAGNGNTASAQKIVPVDTVVPSVSLSAPTTVQNGLFQVTTTFSESVTGLTLAKFSVVGGVASNFAGSGTTYTFDITPTANSSVDVSVALPAGAAIDAAGNLSTLAAQIVPTPIDTIAPTVTMATPSGTQTGLFSVTATFSEAVTGLSSTGFNITNASISNLSGSGKIYTFDVTPTANSAANITIDLAANVAQDSAGNGNITATQAVISADTLVPSVTITPPTGVQNTIFNVRVAFSKNVTGFNEADLSVVGGATSNFATINPYTYTFDIAPTPNSTANVTIDVPANVAFAGAAGNAAATQAVVAVDTLAPIITIGSVTGTQTSPFNITLTPSEILTGFALSDITVTNGTATSLTPSGANYTLSITPTTGVSGNLTIDIAAGVATDAVGNANVAATPTRTVVIDTAPPTATLIATPLGTQTASFTVTADFKEAVAGVAQADLTVSGGSVTAFSATSGSVYTFTVSPPTSTTGNITIDLAANTSADLAGNANTASTQLVVSVDTVIPTVVISAPGGTQSAVFTATATFSENVSGVALADFIVTGGTTSNFVTVSPTIYTFDITPPAGSTTSITIDCAANKATDNAGNGNAAAAQKVVLVNTASPSVTITAPSATQTGLFTVNVNASQALTGLTLADFNIVGGTASNFITVSPTAYTFDITPAANSTTSITIDVPANVAVDGGGNGNGASSQAVVPVDTVIPSLLLTAPTTIQNTTFSVTSTLSEAVTGVALTDFVVVGGTASNFAVINPYTYTFDVTPPPATAGNITIDAAAGIAADAAGNLNTAATQAIVAINTAIPSVSITPPAGTQNGLFSVNVSFSEAVTGLLLTDFTVTGGTPSNLSGTGANYTFNITPNATSTVPVFINLPANAAQNAAGNGNSAAAQVSVPIDTIIPTVSMSAPAGPLNTLFTVTTTFSEPMVGVALTDFTVSSGTPSNFVTINPYTYAFDVTPAANTATNITVDLAANKATDNAGNGNIAAAQISIIADTAAPSASIGLTPPATGTQIGPFNMDLTFSEPVTGLLLSDFTVTGGTATTLAGTGAAYTLSITPNANSSTNVTIDLPSNAATDAVGNPSTAATQAVIAIDTIVPGVSISAPTTTQTGAFVANVTFTEAIVGIAAGDFIITGGTATSFTGSGTAFSLNITPLANSVANVTIKLPAEIATDAAGNPNTASALITVPIDTTIPSVAITAPTATQTGIFATTITYSEDVYGVALADFTVSGATTSNFAVANPYTYTFDVTPASNSTASVTIDVAANTATDPAGNANTAATQAVVPIDTVIPTVTLTPPAGTQIGTFALPVTFSEPVTGLVAADFSVANATASNITGSLSSYSVDITPNTNFTGNISIALPANTAFDSAGNGNTSSTTAVIAADVQLPTAILSVPASPATKTGAFTATATFSEPISGISLSSFTVSGGATSNFVNAGSNVYTFDITPPINSTNNVTIDLYANAIIDLAGNGNPAATQVIVPIDTVAPTIVISPTSGTQTGLFTVNLTSSEALSGLTLADIAVTNGTASNLTPVGINYTVDITPNTGITNNLTIDIAANTATDAAGNGNSAAIQSVVAIDTQPPVVTLTPPTGKQTGLFSVAASFSETVTGITASDFVVAGGTLSNFAGAGTSYSFDITPPLASTTPVTIDVYANSVSDAAGNGNAATQAVVAIDTVSPTVSITPPAGTQSGLFNAGITFSEAVTGFVATDVTVVGGTASNLAGSGASYTMDITPDAGLAGNLTIDVYANVAQDAASNGNSPAPQAIVPIDTKKPTVTVYKPSGTQNTAFTVDVIFNENVTGLTLSDFIVTGGTPSNIYALGGSPWYYRFTITPNTNSIADITIDLPANSAIDPVGNGNIAAAQAVVSVDTAAPIISSPGNPYNFDVNEDTYASFAIVATDSSAITYSLYNNIQPTNGTVTVDTYTSQTTYTPNPNYYGPYGARDPFKVQVTDATGSYALLDVRPRVKNVNDFPVIQSYATGITLNEDVLTTIASTDIYATDIDNSNSQITFVLETSPSSALGRMERSGVPLITGSTFTQNDLDLNIIKFAPAQDVYGATNFSFRYRDLDSGYLPTYASPSLVFPINIASVNDTPTVDTNSTLFTTQNAAATLINDALLHATDPDNLATQISYTVTTLPAKGTLNLTTFTQADITNGLLTYTPNAGITGIDSFSFSVTDGVIATPITATFNISITAPQAALHASSSDGVLINSSANISASVTDFYTNAAFANQWVRFTIQTSPYATFVANGLQSIDVYTDVAGLATAGITDTYAETVPVLVEAVSLGLNQTVQQIFGDNTGVNTVITTSPCNTTWDLTGSPYYIQNNVTLASGCRLQIDPYVIVKFNANKNLTVGSGATLDVYGQAGQEVYFTSVNDDTVGGVAAPYSTSVSNAGDWSYLQYSVGSFGTMRHAQIRYGGGGGFIAALRAYSDITIDTVSILDSGGNGLSTLAGSPQVNNITVSNFGSYGVYMGDTSFPTFTGTNSVSGALASKASVYATGVNVNAAMDGFTITGGKYNVWLDAGANATFTNSVFDAAVDEAIYLTNTNAVSIDSSNTISNTPAPYLITQGFSSADIYAVVDAASVSDLYSVHLTGTLTNANSVLTADPLGTGNSVYRVVGNTYVANNARLQVDPYTVLKFNSAKGLFANSGSILDVWGGIGAPAIFTTVEDNTVGAILPGSTGSPVLGSWNGIEYREGSLGGTFRNAEVRYAVDALHVDGSSPTIENYKALEFSVSGLYFSALFSPTSSNSIINNITLTTSDTSNRPLYILDTFNSGTPVTPTINGGSITTASTSPSYGAIHIYGRGAKPSISNMTINGGYYGVYALKHAGGTFSNNTFTNNTVNVYINGDGSATFTGNTFDGAANVAVQLTDTIPGNVFINNTNTIQNTPAPYLVTGSSFPAGYVAATIDGATVQNSNSLDISGNYFAANSILVADPLATGSSVYHVTSNLYVRAGARLQIDPYAVLKFDAGKGLFVNNNAVLDIYGAVGAPAVFTSVNDDSVGAILVGSTGSPAIGSWGGIDYQGGSHGSVLNANIDYADYALYVRNTSPPITNFKATQFSISGLMVESGTGETTNPAINNLILSTTDTSNYPLYFRGNTSATAVVTPTLNGATITTSSTNASYGAVHMYGKGVHPNLDNVTTHGGFYSLRANDGASTTLTNAVFDGAIDSAIYASNAGTLNINSSNTIQNTGGAAYLVSGNLNNIDTYATVDRASVVDPYSLRLTAYFYDLYTVLTPDPLQTGGGNPLDTYASVYRVTGNTYIANGARMQIDPYAVLKFNNNRGLFVNTGGTLDVYGSPTAPVTFTTINDDSIAVAVSGSTGTPTLGSWGGIDYKRNSSGTFRNAEVNYANTALYVYASSPTIDGLTAHEFSDNGLFIDGYLSTDTASPIVSNIKLSTADTNNFPLRIRDDINNGSTITPVINGSSITTASTNSSWGAIHITGQGANPTISNITVNGGYYGVYASTHAGGTFNNNTFTNNTVNAYINGNGVATFASNTFDNASYAAVQLINTTAGNVHIDSSNTIQNAAAPYAITQGFPAADVYATLNTASIADPYSINLQGTFTNTNSILIADPLGTGSSVYRVVANVNIANGARMQIDPYAVLKFNNTKGLFVNTGGTLDVYGSPTAPVIFTTVNDDSIAAALSGSTGTPLRGAWGGVDYQRNSSGTFRNAEVNYANTAMYVIASSPTIDSLTAHEFADAGLYIDGYLSTDAASPIVNNITLSTADTGNYPIHIRDDINSGSTITPVINGGSITTAAAGLYAAIWAEGQGSNPTISNLTIRGGHYGLYAGPTASGTFNDNIIKNAISIGAEMNTTGVVNMSNNRILGNPTGILISNADPTSVIENNLIRSNSTAGVSVAATQTTPGLALRNNLIVENGTGVHILENAATQTGGVLTMQSNTIANNTTGLVLDTYASATITDNIVANNTTNLNNLSTSASGTYNATNDASFIHASDVVGSPMQLLNAWYLDGTPATLSPAIDASVLRTAAGVGYLGSNPYAEPSLADINQLDIGYHHAAQDVTANINAAQSTVVADTLAPVAGGVVTVIATVKDSAGNTLGAGLTLSSAITVNSGATLTHPAFPVDLGDGSYVFKFTAPVATTGSNTVDISANGILIGSVTIVW